MIGLYSSSSRLAVIREAETWLRTPYRHMGRVKGRGVDCLTLLAEVYEAAGVVPHVEIPFYSPDWHMHRSAERYMEGLLRYAREIEGPPQLGDVALFKFGRCFAHGGITVDWPRMIHAWHTAGVVYGDASQVQLKDRARRFFDPFGAA
jgi:NlpC/P60 family putative phage cell wall peptidase